MVWVALPRVRVIYRVSVAVCLEGAGAGGGGGGGLTVAHHCRIPASTDRRHIQSAQNREDWRVLSTIPDVGMCKKKGRGVRSAVRGAGGGGIAIREGPIQLRNVAKNCKKKKRIANRNPPPCGELRFQAVWWRLVLLVECAPRAMGQAVPGGSVSGGEGGHDVRVSNNQQDPDPTQG